MVTSPISNINLQEFISKLKINPEQEKFLLDELPRMSEKDRLELLRVLKNVYSLNKEEDKAIKRVKDNWQKIKKPA